MDVILVLLAWFFILLGILETACYRLFFAGYFRLGWVAQREEWQSAVPLEVAHSAMGRLLDTGEVAGCRRGDLYCFRNDAWEWTPTPRSVVMIVEGVKGAAFIHEVRQFFGVLWFSLGFAGWMAGTGHEAFGAVIALLAPIYQMTAWRLNLKAWGRLRSIRRALRLVGVQICEHCGYDLFGLPTNHECPECGQFSDGKQGRPNLERIGRCIDRRTDTRQGQAALYFFAGTVMLLVTAAMWTFVVLLAMGRRGPALRNLGILFWVVFAIVMLSGTIVSILRHRGLVNEYDPELPDPTGGYYFQRWAGMRFSLQVLTKLVLVGPDLFVEGISNLRSNRLTDAERERAVRMLMELMGRTSGMPWEDLRGLEDTMEETHRTARWLHVQGWIGFTDRGRRVFLYSQSREELHAGV